MGLDNCPQKLYFPKSMLHEEHRDLWCLPYLSTFVYFVLLHRGEQQDCREGLVHEWYFPDRVHKQDLGAPFTSKLKVEIPPSQPAGPNQVLSDHGPASPDQTSPPKGDLDIIRGFKNPSTPDAAGWTTPTTPPASLPVPSNTS